jgi:hypothetical protein
MNELEESLKINTGKTEMQSQPNKGNTANCLVLYFEEYSFKNWFNQSVTFLSSINLTPTHIGIQGIGTSNKIIRYQSGYKKLIQSDFQNITSIGLYVCDKDEKSPGFNWITCCTIYFSRFVGFTCFWGIDENQALDKKDMANMMKSYIREYIPLYGYEYQCLHEKYPCFYALGMSSQKSTIEEKERLKITTEAK